MTGHIDQLTEWYESAERITKTNLPRVGDTLILPSNAGGFGIELERDGWTPDIVTTGEPVRILARAPKPKPAWHDAAAVMAVTPGRPERRVFTREVEPGWWVDADSSYKADELAHVTPLIEAKVTDEMVESAREEAKNRAGVYWRRSFVSRVLTAALGLETE